MVVYRHPQIFVVVYGYEFGSGDAYVSGPTLRAGEWKLDRRLNPEGDGLHLNRCGSVPTQFRAGVVETPLGFGPGFTLDRKIRGSWAEEQILPMLHNWAFETSVSNAQLRGDSIVPCRERWNLNKNDRHPDDGWKFPLPSYFWEAWRAMEIAQQEADISQRRWEISAAKEKITRLRRVNFNTYYRDGR